jgi:hypothetical protein
MRANDAAEKGNRLRQTEMRLFAHWQELLMLILP